ncbi:gluconate 2-dehydrogenase subunit 3 family protein [Mucilaginibacter robiniae]|uniref:Gluconate 2-dehydrogenase subunit 3 family protein n=2 Tax=Mucilaginibacter robiniae TaxID=2728022 RepID=A0A7L5DXK3_9SPHI|nr:gluconate 2-dehydrogenase subunit 3 family protein [Mucilaginibacter robiniae]
MEEPVVTEPKFFSAALFKTLQAVCSRLIPQDTDAIQVDLAGTLDLQLERQQGDGWRYDVLPNDQTAHTQGMQGIEEVAEHLYQQSFTALSTIQQDKILAAVQEGKVNSPIWQHLNATRYFEELLVTITAAYYCHPAAKDEIGDVSWADAAGWQHIGLNQLEPIEPPTQ